MFFFALLGGSCGVGATSTSQAVTTPAATYYHTGFAAGPALFTDAEGAVVDERRTEPFGVPIDAGDPIARDLNALNKRTEPTTGWSDHGARWLVPATARWLAIDPPVTGPSADYMLRPWDLHPYQYVAQNPAAYWDPDGRERGPLEHSAVIPSGTPGQYALAPWMRAELHKALPPGSMIKGTIEVAPANNPDYFPNSGAGAYTVGSRITMKTEDWARMDYTQYYTVAHEAVHVAQFHALTARLWATHGRNAAETAKEMLMERAQTEYAKGGAYAVPLALWRTPTNEIDLLDSRYTVDQIAQRISIPLAITVSKQRANDPSLSAEEREAFAARAATIERDLGTHLRELAAAEE